MNETILPARQRPIPTASGIVDIALPVHRRTRRSGLGNLRGGIWSYGYAGVPQERRRELEIAMISWVVTHPWTFGFWCIICNIAAFSKVVM